MLGALNVCSPITLGSCVRSNTKLYRLTCEFFDAHFCFHISDTLKNPAGADDVGLSFYMNINQLDSGSFPIKREYISTP